jgi:mycofactocin system glycosyltransferase
VLIGGSPLKLFRLTDAGDRIVDRIVADDAVPDSALVASLLDAGAIHPVHDVPDRFTELDVTVIVPTLGPARHAPIGAVIVDDGSEPPVAGATIRLATNRGPGAARNAGLERVTTALVAFVDSDVRLPADWLAPLLAHFDDERVALVAPRVASRPGTSTLAAYEAANSPLDLGGRAGRVRAGSRISYVPAAAVVCRTDAIRDLGGFDTTLRFGEDVDLVWRLADAGWRVRYEPAGIVHHDPRSSWSAWLAQRVGYGSSAAPLAHRHPGALAPLRLSGWSVATWVLGLAHPAIGATIGLGSATALIRKLPEVPPATAFRLAWRGNLHAGEQIASAIRRVWWPLLLLAGVRSRRSRLALALAALAARSPLRWLDDTAYSLGVWRGVLQERTAAPLIPEISSWPGRRSHPPSGGAH